MKYLTYLIFYIVNYFILELIIFSIKKRDKDFKRNEYIFIR